MSVETVLRGVASRGEAAGAEAVPRAGDLLATRVAAALPDVAVRVENAAVVLQAPGLVARAFGTRHRAADAWLSCLAAIVAGDGA